MDEQLLSIEAAFGDLEDPRRRTPAYDLTEMLVVALCAILSGAESWLAIQTWGDEKLEWLREYIELPQGIPSHDTFGRVFAALNPKQFEACFIRWMSPLFPALTGQVVAIDGKTVRRSIRRDQRAIHLVSAYGAGLGMVLGQVRTAEKSNEITAIPELLDALMLKGAVVTIDAMGCQRSIARQIIDAGADYVLAAKANHIKAYTRIVELHEAVKRLPEVERRRVAFEHHDVDKGHGRIETRHCTTIDWLALNEIAPWPSACSVAIVDSCREIGQSTSRQRRYFFTSLPANDPARIAQAIRAHWAIESMHWTLDVS